MNDTIHKYPLELKDYQSVELPLPAQILHIGKDPSGQICLWARVNPSKRTSHRGIYTVGTGQEIEDETVQDHEGKHVLDKKHIGTVIDGDFVWHYFTI